jgi:hypothetical protein
MKETLFICKKIWSISDLSLMSTLSSHTAQINAIEPLYNGNVASGSDDTMCIIWSMTDFSIVKKLGPAGSAVKFLTQLNTGLLAVGYGDNHIQFWNFTYLNLSSFDALIDNTILAMTEVDGQLFVSDNQQSLYKISEVSCTVTMKVTGFPGSINAMKVSMDGAHFAVGMSSRQFAYYQSTVSTASVGAPLVLSSNLNHTILSMDRYLNVFITGDNSGEDNLPVWSWDVNPVTNTLNTGSGFPIASSVVVPFFACLNQTSGL